MDDLTKQVLNEVAEPVTAETESPTVETNDTEVQAEESVATEDKAEETVEQPTKEENDQPPKKGAESRIRELNSQVKQERAEKESLARQIQELTGSVEPQGYKPDNGYNPNQPLVAPGEEVTIEELNARQAKRDQWLLQQADNMARFREQQRETINRINNESSQAEKAYPQLNPDSDAYDEELSNSIAEASLAFVKSNPAGSLTKFVDGLMKPYMRSLDRSVASQQTEITKQAFQTAMRPNNVPSTEKKVEDMDIKELEKKLGVVY